MFLQSHYILIYLPDIALSRLHDVHTPLTSITIVPGMSLSGMPPVLKRLFTGYWDKGGVFLNTAGDIHILPIILEATSNFNHLTPDDVMEEMVAELEMGPLFV
jgi:hypothetical protein